MFTSAARITFAKYLAGTIIAAAVLLYTHNEEYILKKRADLGDAAAQYEFGKKYSPDDDRLKWYLLAAEQGNLDAQNSLGAMYEHGWGVEQDYDEALKWYHLVAKQGYVSSKSALAKICPSCWEIFSFKKNYDSAQSSLGWMYYHGKGVEKDYNEAMVWFRLSANRLDSQEKMKFAEMYEIGEGVKQSYYEALDWYILSAEDGNSYAQKKVGEMYATGKGAQQDYNEAIKWYRLAAEQGDVDAQINLGNHYYYGLGVVENYREAYIWFALSSVNGDVHALRQKSADKLSPEQLHLAQEEAQKRLDEIKKKQNE